MCAVIVIGAVTVGINVQVTQAELQSLGLSPGSFSDVSAKEIERLRLRLERQGIHIPQPRSGGSGANTANLLARAGVSCGLLGVGGDDAWGRLVLSHCEAVSLNFLGRLRSDAVTGYDFCFFSEDGSQSSVMTWGANALLSPEDIDLERIQGAELLVLDGFALSFGPDAEAALTQCAEIAEASGIPFVLTLASTGVIQRHRDFYARFGPKAQMLIGNLEQAAVLLDLNLGLDMGLEAHALRKKLETALAQNPCNIVVTLDAGGAFARFEGKNYFQPTQPLQALDATGAGDSFLASFIVARRRALSIQQALAVGNQIAAQVIQYEGARLPPSVDVTALMQTALLTEAGHFDEV